MPRGVPKAGFRRTKNFTKRARGGFTPTMTVTDQFDQFAPDTDETEAQIREKLGMRFKIMTKMVKATMTGTVPSVIVSGPAGLGKTHEATETLDNAPRKKVGDMYTQVKGRITPLGLYTLLYHNRDKGKVILFDDCDCVFTEEDTLNLMKGACDSSLKRKLSWISSMPIVDADGKVIPQTFEFCGSIIFITNYDFDQMIARGSKLAPHFEALMSRSHYIDMAMHTRRDYITRIRMVVENGMLKSMGMTPAQAAEIVKFVEDNQMHMRELSLRMVKKLADLYKMDRNDWQDTARVTLMRNKA